VAQRFQRCGQAFFSAKALASEVTLQSGRWNQTGFRVVSFISRSSVLRHSGGIMRSLTKLAGVPAILLLACTAAVAKPAADDRGSLVIIFKDGHRQSLSMSEITRIDFKPPAAIVYRDGHHEKLSADVDRIEFGATDAAMMPTRAHFVGKWQVGEGDGNATFYITLDADGTARKTLGPPHGTWTLVDGEARISWDDGWHDIICKVGTKHEKRAFEPNKSFDETPSNVTPARNTDPKPI
jgi:hypothetical protein